MSYNYVPESWMPKKILILIYLQLNFCYQDSFMEDKQEKVLSENWRVLRKCLEPTKLLPHLETVLDYEDKEKIKNQTNRADQSDLLLDILPRRGPRAFDCFVKALQAEKTQDYLAHILKKQIGNNSSSLSLS